MANCSVIILSSYHLLESGEFKLQRSWIQKNERWYLLENAFNATRWISQFFTYDRDNLKHWQRLKRTTVNQYQRTNWQNWSITSYLLLIENNFYKKLNFLKRKFIFKYVESCLININEIIFFKKKLVTRIKWVTFHD